MTVIYRVIITTRTGHEAWFEFNNPEQAMKFADNAMISNVDSIDGPVFVKIELLEVRRVDE